MSGIYGSEARFFLSYVINRDYNPRGGVSVGAFLPFWPVPIGKKERLSKKTFLLRNP